MEFSCIEILEGFLQASRSCQKTIDINPRFILEQLVHDVRQAHHLLILQPWSFSHCIVFLENVTSPLALS